MKNYIKIYKGDCNIQMKNYIKIYKGDCLKVIDELIEKNIKVDCIITDPPYGTTDNKWDSIIPLNKMWEKINKVSKENTPIILFGNEPFSSTLRISNSKIYKYDWKWNKSQVTNFLNSKKQPLRKMEDIMVFYKKQPTYNPQMTKGTPYEIKRTHKTENYSKQINNETKNKGERFPTNLIEIPQIRVKNGHPTQKPVSLIEYLCRTYSNEGDLILDFTAGSFTTAIACINTKRNFIGIEIENKYFNMGKKRIQDHITKEYELEIIE